MADIWLSLERRSDSLPMLRSVSSCGYRYMCSSCEIIIYEQPDTRHFQYYSMRPLSLDVSPYSPPSGGSSSLSKVSKMGEQMMLKRVSVHTASLAASTPDQMKLDDQRGEMDSIIQQVNYSSDLELIALTPSEKLVGRADLKYHRRVASGQRSDSFMYAYEIFSW